MAGIVDCRAGSTAIEQVLNAHADLIIFTELVLADHIDGGVAVDLASSKAGNANQAIISAIEIGGLHAVAPGFTRLELKVGGQFERWDAVASHDLQAAPGPSSR